MRKYTSHFYFNLLTILSMPNLVVRRTVLNTLSSIIQLSSKTPFIVRGIIFLQDFFFFFGNDVHGFRNSWRIWNLDLLTWGKNTKIPRLWKLSSKVEDPSAMSVSHTDFLAISLLSFFYSLFLSFMFKELRSLPSSICFKLQRLCLHLFFGVKLINMALEAVKVACLTSWWDICPIAKRVITFKQITGWCLRQSYILSHNSFVLSNLIRVLSGPSGCVDPAVTSRLDGWSCPHRSEILNPGKG